MPRFRHIHEILRLMHNKEVIRNIGVVAHIDHGKTTLTDSLLADAGLLPLSVAGRAKALDYLEEEQRRGITIKTANIALSHTVDNRQYLVNLVDTPGHVDFTGKVNRALRAIDGAIVVVDAVEGIMAQTETVIRQALEERVKPVLLINKVDRLISELKLDVSEVQERFVRIIDEFNSLIAVHGEQKFKSAWRVSPEKGSAAFGSALHKWGFTLESARQRGIRFSDIVDAYARNKHETLSRAIPLSEAILSMVVERLPNPAEAQKYRIPKIWRGELDSYVGRAMVNCADDGPATMCVTMAQLTKNEGLIATGRLFSGFVESGENVYLVNAKKEFKIKNVSVYMGSSRETVEAVYAGNIAALAGLDLARAGETIVSAEYKSEMVPFESIRYVSEPVVTVAVEPKNPADLPRLIEAINSVAVEDPNITPTIDRETGQYLLSGLGELHLEIALKFLKQHFGGMEILTSKPVVAYRESVQKRGKIVMAKSLNKENAFYVQVEPLENAVLELIEEGLLTQDMKRERVIETLCKRANYGLEEAEGFLALNEHRNMLFDVSKTVWGFPETVMSIVFGFNWACRNGPLCEEPLRGVKVKIVDMAIHENLEKREPEQIMRAFGRAVLGACLTADPFLLEPVYRVEFSVPTEFFGACTGILNRRRGKIVASEQRGMLTIIVGYVPVAETFGLAEEMRSATSGRAFWQCTFHHWERVPEELANATVRYIRERKGLTPEIPKPEKFIDKSYG
ncbi:MAG: elongation factor EF-2 [Candidatus Bathyarchaeia archaeon]